MRWLTLVALATLAACDGEDTDGNFCQAGELDCSCNPALPSGCDGELLCNASGVCVEELDDDTEADTEDDTGAANEFGPISATMVGWTAGQDTAALCRTMVGDSESYLFSFSPTCNSGVTVRWSWFDDPSSLHFISAVGDDIVAATGGTVVAEADGAPGSVIDLPADTDVTITTSEGRTYTFQLNWNDAQATYDVNVSSLTSTAR